jgi:hypothetical protein
MSAINTYLETGKGPSVWLVRIKPDSIRGSHTLRKPERLTITKATGWRPLTRPNRDLLAALALARESDKSGAPLVFDVCSREEALALEQRETIKARTSSNKRRTVAEALRESPNAPTQAPTPEPKPKPAEAPEQAPARGRGRPPKPKAAPEPPPPAPEPVELEPTQADDGEVVDVDDFD